MQHENNFSGLLSPSISEIWFYHIHFLTTGFHFPHKVFEYILELVMLTCTLRAATVLNDGHILEGTSLSHQIFYITFL